MRHIIKRVTMAAILLLMATRIMAGTPELEFVMQLRVNCSGAEVVGTMQHGKRQYIPITGGTFQGPEIKGVVLPGGADYQIESPTMQRTDLEAIYNIRTDDGVTIHVRNTGIIANTNGSWYFVTSPKFEAPIYSKYAWLNNAIYVCRPNENGMPGGVVLDVWRVK